MKTITNKHNIDQEHDFQKRVEHLTGVVGLANWRFASPTVDEVRSYEETAHTLRANAVHFTATQGLKNAGVKIKHWLDQCIANYRKHRTARILLQLEDHILEDIGINRSDLRAHSIQYLNATGNPSIVRDIKIHSERITTKLKCANDDGEYHLSACC